MRRGVYGVGGWCVFWLWALAAAGWAELPPGTQLLGSDPLHALTFSSPGSAYGVRQYISVAGTSFTEAIRVETKIKPTNSWDIRLTGFPSSAIEQEDILLFSFWMRATQTSQESGTGRAEFVFERRASPYDKSVIFPMVVGGEWLHYHVPFAAHSDFTTGTSQAVLRLGFDPQTVEIAAVDFLNYRKTVNLGDLPYTRMSYAGREIDAPWRVSAAARIEANRKGDLTVLVRNALGQPLAGGRVVVRMKRHAYGFGSALNASYAFGAPDSAEKARYRSEFRRLFNKAVLENAHKWTAWEGPNKARAIEATDWLTSNGIAVRGHCLVWPRWDHMPADVQGLASSPTALRQRCGAHVTDEAAYFAGQLVEWDVVNETTACHDVQDICGQDVLSEWFQLTRQSDPQAVLYINEYSILSGNGANADHLESEIRYLQDAGAPVGGVGMQSHFSSAVTPPHQVVAMLDRFSSFGLALQVTEFDVSTADEDLQADYTRDFLTAVFSHPATVGFIMWGFWDGRHWKNDAPLFNLDWSLKKSGAEWIRLVYDEWWTNADGQSDGAGQFRTRGFLGDYEIAAEYGGTTRTVSATLPIHGATVTIDLPVAPPGGGVPAGVRIFPLFR